MGEISIILTLFFQMLQVDAKKRITIKDLLTHPWLMEGYDRPIKWQSKYHGNDIDTSIIEEMAVYKLTTTSLLTEKLKKWEYDYNTATYLLMFEKKQVCNTYFKEKNSSNQDRHAVKNMISIYRKECP